MATDATTKPQIPVAVGKGHQRHYRRDETTTVCGKVGVLRDLQWAADKGLGATCRHCNGDAAAIRRFR